MHERTRPLSRRVQFVNRHEEYPVHEDPVRLDPGRAHAGEDDGAQPWGPAASSPGGPGMLRMIRCNGVPANHWQSSSSVRF